MKCKFLVLFLLIFCSICNAQDVYKYRSNYALLKGATEFIKAQTLIVIDANNRTITLYTPDEQLFDIIGCEQLDDNTVKFTLLNDNNFKLYGVLTSDFFMLGRDEEVITFKIEN